MNKYFAYGSNMNPDRVSERGLEVIDMRAARLPQYRLTFNKVSAQHASVAHANIMWARGQMVEGILYDLAADAEILKMDPFERAPWNYGREAIRVETDRGLEWTWTYFANPAVLQEGCRPTTEYLGHLLAGESFLSPSYYAALERTATVD